MNKAMDKKSKFKAKNKPIIVNVDGSYDTGTSIRLAKVSAKEYSNYVKNIELFYEIENVEGRAFQSKKSKKELDEKYSKYRKNTGSKA